MFRGRVHKVEEIEIIALVQTRFMKDVKDITRILYQIAVAAGVLIVVF